MTISELLDAIIGYQPLNYIVTETGAYVRWIDQRYIASVVLVVVVTFCLFYGLLNLVRIISSAGGKKS